MPRHPITFMAVFVLLLLSLSGCHQSAPVSSAGSKGVDAEQVAQNWQRQGIISEPQHIRAMRTLESIRQTGQVSDGDLNWLLALLKQPTSNPTAVHLLVMAELININLPSASQNHKVREAMFPFQQSNDPTEQQLANLILKNSTENTIDPSWMWIFAFFVISCSVFIALKLINERMGKE